MERKWRVEARPPPRSVVRAGRIVTLAVAVSLSSVLAADPKADVGASVAATIVRIRRGDRTAKADLLKLGSQTVPILAEYVDDASPEVRHAVTIAMGRAGDRRGIPFLLERLGDSDLNVRRSAMMRLYMYGAAVIGRRSDVVAVVLSHYAQRWDSASHKAVLLLGDLGDTEAVSLLRGLLAEARANPSQLELPSMCFVLMEEACVKALFKLGEESTVQMVTSWLTGDEPAKRGLAADCVAHAQRTDLAAQVLPLLDDSRPALRMPGWPHSARVCDLALTALVSLRGLKPSFPVERGFAYSDARVAEVRRLLEEKTR